MRRVSVLLFVWTIGCVDHGAEGMLILNNTAAPVGTTCTLTGDTTQPFTTHGEIFAGAGVAYLMTPLIASRFTSSDSQASERTITLEGADITLSQASDTGDLSVVAQYTSLFAATLAPQATINASFDLIPVSTLSAIFASGKDAELSANITIFGDEGGGRIDGQPFDYPVTACVEINGTCIVQSHGMCPLTVATARLGDPCNIYQDVGVDCCTDPTSGALLCPGPTQ